MNILEVGNVVKSKTGDKLMIININIREIDKKAFNKEALGYILNQDFPNDEKCFIYSCFVDDDKGITKKLEFKRDELIFIRAKY
jgi:hypothetical protein